MFDMFGIYKEVTSQDVSEFQALTKPGWLDFLRENPLLTSKEVTFTYSNGFIHEQWTPGILARVFKWTAILLRMMAFMIYYLITALALMLSFICQVAHMPANFVFQILIMASDMLVRLTIPISEVEYEYMLDNPIPFKGLEGEDVVMTATEDDPTLTLVDVDAFGNEIVTERMFSDEGMEQTTFLRRGGARAVRKFEKISH